MEGGTISGKMLKDLYDLCFERGKDFPAVYEEEGAATAIYGYIGAGQDHRRDRCSRTPSRSSSIAQARRRMLGFFVGQVMKASQRASQPQIVNELLAKKLE